MKFFSKNSRFRMRVAPGEVLVFNKGVYETNDKETIDKIKNTKAYKTGFVTGVEEKDTKTTTKKPQTQKKQETESVETAGGGE